MELALFLAATDLTRTKSPTQLYDELLEVAVLADELGFDQVWFPEHDLVNYMLNTDAMQQSLQVCERTSRIRSGSSIFVTPFYHPLRLASDIAQLDHLTGGRFEPGFGRGGSKYEQRQLEVLRPEEESKQRFAEFMEVVRASWSSEESLEYHGDCFDFDNALVLPRPYTPSGPPMWVASTSPGGVGYYAEQGWNILFSPWHRPWQQVEDSFQAFATGRAKASADTRFCCQRTTFVSDTMEQAREILPLVRQHALTVGAGMRGVEKIVNGVRTWPDDFAVPDTDDDFMTNLVIGDPATVTEKVAAYQELGIDQYSAHMTLGEDHKALLRSVELFGTKVIPALQGSTT